MASLARDYAGDGDLRLMQQLAVECARRDAPLVHAHVGDLAWRMYQHLEKLDTVRLRLWLSEEGQAQAWGWLWLPGELDFQVHPDRIPGRVDDVLDWFEETAQPTDSGFVTVWALDSNQAIVAALEARGYERGEDSAGRVIRRLLPLLARRGEPARGARARRHAPGLPSPRPRAGGLPFRPARSARGRRDRCPRLLRRRQRGHEAVRGARIPHAGAPRAVPARNLVAPSGVTGSLDGYTSDNRDRKDPYGDSSDRDLLRAGGTQERQARHRRLLGRVVWPVPRRLADPRADRRRARRPAEAREGQHRRGARTRAALRRRVDPHDDPLQGRRSVRVRGRRAAQGRARALARTGGVGRALRRFLLINPRAGEGRRTEEVQEAARRRDVHVHVLRPGEEPAELARRANAEALGVAAGDGSLGPVAAVAVERDVPFFCVPLGSRNHFARDLGLDLGDPIAALAALDGPELRVDVGRIGDRLFVNNVTLGLYAELVHRRERHRRRRDALASLRALMLLARDRGRSQHFRVDGQRVNAPVLLVASNAYELDAFNVGARERLDDGLLHLYVAHGWRPSTWEERSSDRFTVDGSGMRVRAAIDGEPVVLTTPFEFTLERRALRVLVPPG